MGESTPGVMGVLVFGMSGAYLNRTHSQQQNVSQTQ